LFVIRPEQVEAFLAPLPVSKIPGVGKVMNAKLEALSLHTCANLRAFDARELERRFGRFGPRLQELAWGVDHRAVVPDQPVQSISAEDTFERDCCSKRSSPRSERSRGRPGPRRARPNASVAPWY